MPDHLGQLQLEVHKSYSTEDGPSRKGYEQSHVHLSSEATRCGAVVVWVWMAAVAAAIVDVCWPHNKCRCI